MFTIRKTIYGMVIVDEIYCHIECEAERMASSQLNVQPPLLQYVSQGKQGFVES